VAGGTAKFLYPAERGGGTTPKGLPVEPLASAAASAIENAHLYAETQERTDALAETLHAELQADLLQVMGDADHLRRALENLLSNAVKFTAPGGTIVVRLGWDGKVVVLRMANSGIGIPEEEGVAHCLENIPPPLACNAS